MAKWGGIGCFLGKVTYINKKLLNKKRGAFFKVIVRVIFVVEIQPCEETAKLGVVTNIYNMRLGENSIIYVLGDNRSVKADDVVFVRASAFWNEIMIFCIGNKE